MKDRTFIILTPGFPADEQDSTCLPAQQSFVKALKNNFPDLNIIILAFQYPFSKQEYLWNGIQVIPFNGRNKGKLSRIVTWIKVWRTLKKLKTENHPIDLFSFWYGECALLGKRFSERYNAKHLTWLLGQDARAKNKYVKWLHPKAEELVAMSVFLSQEFERNYVLRPKFVVPNGVDPHLFSASLMERDLDILGVGSLIPLKMYDIFIDIIEELKSQFPFIKASICGKGEEFSVLQSMIVKKRLSDTIELAGEKSHPEVLQMMQRSKIFLHPSSYEGFSGACLEALYAGAHVISFCNPMDKKISHWHIVHNKEEMIQKVIAILNNPNVDYSPVLPFSMDDSAKAVMQLFHR
ncbi:MAG TPA: hypothetical protein DIT07_01300 [Sphingobacteriaceae bacterium]|nr:hypothetical protein [Sphingobacteriaceae bacterium]